MKSLKESLGIGGLGGFVASLCCFGPLILVLFGLSGASFALSLSRYRPYFLSLSAIFLVVAIYFYLKKKEGVCSLKTMKSNWLMIIVTIIVTVVVWILLVYVITPILAPAVYKG